MKKIILTICAFLTLIIIGELRMNGRERNTSQCYNTTENNDIRNTGHETTREAERNKAVYEENPEKSGDIFNDLVYREYSFGCDLEEGCNIIIESDRVIDEVDDVQRIVILIDNNVYNEFDLKRGILNSR